MMKNEKYEGRLVEAGAVLFLTLLFNRASSRWLEWAVNTSSLAATFSYFHLFIICAAHHHFVSFTYLRNLRARLAGLGRSATRDSVIQRRGGLESTLPSSVEQEVVWGGWEDHYDDTIDQHLHVFQQLTWGQRSLAPVDMRDISILLLSVAILVFCILVKLVLVKVFSKVLMQVPGSKAGCRWKSPAWYPSLDSAPQVNITCL